MRSSNSGRRGTSLKTEPTFDMLDTREHADLSVIQCSSSTLKHSFDSEAWTWEAAAGPGKEDPFREDWRRCQLLWGQGEEAEPLALPAVSTLNT